MSPIPAQMTSHWWQRPGRLPGRELYHWHMLFHDQPEVRELAAVGQRKMADQVGLDMIPMPWLHLTTYVVGFADEVADSAIEGMMGDAARRLSAVAPIRVSLGRIGYATQAIVLVAEPAGALIPVLDAVRAATGSAGCEGYSDTDPWIPHISIAYSNASIPTAPIVAALGRRLPPTEITIRSISLVAQTQVGRSWQWRSVAEIPLAGLPLDPASPAQPCDGFGNSPSKTGVNLAIHLAGRRVRRGRCGLLHEGNRCPRYRYLGSRLGATD